MTELAPKAWNGFYHNDRHISYAGGTYGDSKGGTKEAGRQGHHRIDQNGQAVLRNGRLYPVNAHGSPFNPSYVSGRWTAHKWLPLHVKHPRLRNARKTFKHAKKYMPKNVVVEWEAKDFHPYANAAMLDEYFEQVRADAQAVWGADWPDHVIVKVLAVGLRGGKRYAFKVLRAAHRAGFTTMILAHGSAAHEVINEPFIDYNRGGKVR